MYRVGWATLVAGGLSLVGCSTPAPSPTVTETVAPAISAQSTCEQMSSVLTLAINLQKSSREGRLSDEEFTKTLQALYEITDRVEVQSRTDLSSAVIDLRDTIRRISSSDFQDALSAMSTACEAAGSELIPKGWFGG